MLSIGILFMTSSLGLMPSARIINATTSSTMGLPVSQVRMMGKSVPMFVAQGWKYSLWSATLIPSNLLPENDNDDSQNHSLPLVDENADDFRGQEQSQQQEKIVPSQFCRAIANQNPDTVTISQANSSTSAKLVKSQVVDISWISRQILRSLKTLFRLSHRLEQKIAPTSTSAVVIHRQNNHQHQNYEVWLKHHFIAKLSTLADAQVLKTRLNRLLETTDFQASQFNARIVDGIPTLMVGNRVLLQITPEVKQQITISADLLAVEWLNNLRVAFGLPRLPLVQAQTQMYGLTPSRSKLSGLASWYGPYFHGRTTANGETFNENDLTVAHKSLPFNTFLHVRNRKNGQSVIVRVNDRGPYIPPRSLDLSRVAARCIDAEDSGVVAYEAIIMDVNQPAFSLNPRELGEKLTRKRQKPRQIAIVSEF